MPVKGLPGGSFSACVRKMRDEQGITDPRGFCAWKTHELTGKWPAEESLRDVAEAYEFEEQVQESMRMRMKIRETMDAKGALSIHEIEDDPLAVTMDGVVFEFGTSKNGHTYGEQCVESAIQVFANKPIRLDHPSRSEDRDLPERSVGDQVGKLPPREGFHVGATPRGNQGLLYEGAILSYSPTDRWIADRIRAGILGDVSLNGMGEVIREADGTYTVKNFVEGASLDLVTTAAAGGRAAVRESNGNSEEDDMTDEQVRQIVQESMRGFLSSLTEDDEVAKIAESEGLNAEQRRLLEATAKRLREQDMPEDDEEQEETMAQLNEEESDQVSKLPDPLAGIWRTSYEQCEEGPAVCNQMAWLAVVKNLLPEQEETEMVSGEPVSEGKDPKAKMEESAGDSVAQAVATLIEAGWIEPGKITGMGQSYTQQQRQQRESTAFDLEDFVEKTIMEATGDERFAKAARRE